MQYDSLLDGAEMCAFQVRLDSYRETLRLSDINITPLQSINNSGLQKYMAMHANVLK